MLFKQYFSYLKVSSVPMILLLVDMVNKENILHVSEKIKLKVIQECESSEFSNRKKIKHGGMGITPDLSKKYCTCKS